jgi:ribosome-binding protein aMBF1 (putative translation factor)
MSMVDQSIIAIRAAVTRFKKKPLADRANISDSLLRNVHDSDWDPRSTTLRRLEKAAVELEQKHGDSASGSKGESLVRNPTKGRARK